MEWDPNDKYAELRATRGTSKQPTGWGVWIFLGACAVVGAALVIILR
jgi:hypothetical protein